MEGELFAAGNRMQVQPTAPACMGCARASNQSTHDVPDNVKHIHADASSCLHLLPTCSSPADACRNAAQHCLKVAAALSMRCEAHLPRRQWPVHLPEDVGEQPIRPVAGVWIQHPIKLCHADCLNQAQWANSCLMVMQVVCEPSQVTCLQHNIPPMHLCLASTTQSN